jgi:hypothetical protein
MEMKSETLKEYRKYLGSGVLGGRFHVGRPHGAQVQTRELEIREIGNMREKHVITRVIRKPVDPELWLSCSMGL